MAKKNFRVYNGKSLLDYSKRYSNRNLKVVEKVDADKNPNLLENKSWWLIEDKYYEVPAKKGVAGWWTSMGTTGRVVTCILAAGVIATAVAVPVALSMNQTSEYHAVVDPSVADICKVSQKKLDNGALEITMTYDSSKVVSELEIYMGNAKLVLGTDYTLVGDVIVINKEALAKYGVKEIVVKPTLNNKVFVTSVAISNTVTQVAVGSKIELTAKVLPDNASNKEILWEVTGGDGQALPESVDDKTFLKGIKAGKVTVKATAADGSGKFDTKEFTVIEDKVLVTSINIDAPKAEIGVGETLQFTAAVKPDNATDKSVKWLLNFPQANKAGATIDENGLLTATGAGEVQVYAIAKDGSEVQSNTFNLEVKASEIKVETVEISTYPRTVEEGKQIELTANVYPEDATNKVLIWYATNSEGTESKEAHIVTNAETGVSYLVGDAVGEVKVTAKATDGSEKYDTQTFTVEAGISEIRIEQEPKKLEYVEGDTLDLTGLIVTGKKGQDWVDITDDCVTSPAEGQTLYYGEDKVTVYYTPTEKETSFDIKVSGKPEPDVLRIYQIGTEFKDQVIAEGILTEKDDKYYYNGVEVVFDEIEREGYANNLQYKLDVDIEKGGSNVVDLYITENEDSVYYEFKDDKYSLDISNVKGTAIEGLDYDDMFKYTIKNNTSDEGKLKGVGVDITPSLYIYKADIASSIGLGVTPEEVYENIKDMEGFVNATSKVKTGGYQPFCSMDDLYRMFTKMFSEQFTYIAEDGTRHFAIPKEFDSFIDLAMDFCKKENGYVKYNLKGNAIRAWGDAWYESMGDENTLGFIGPRWLIDGQIATHPRTEEGKEYCWNACPTPNASFWGGSNLSIAASSNSKDLAKQFIKDVFDVKRLETGYEYANVPNSVTLISKYAKSTDKQYTIPLFGGVKGDTPQNPYGYILDVAKQCEGTVITKNKYEAGCANIFMGNPYSYLLSRVYTKEEITDLFKEIVKGKFGDDIVID